VTQVAAPARTEAPPAKQPFKGLAAYKEIDHLLFFGRERDRKIVGANLRSSRLTLLYGPSGVGKSSLLRAGVLTDLRGRAQDALDAGQAPKNLPVIVDDWSGDPVATLAEAIRAAVKELHGDDVAERLPQKANLSQTLEAWSEAGSGVLLVILDQFEEYFVSHPDEDGEGTFAVEFPRAVNRRELRVHFLVSIREDALARLDRFKGRIPTLFSNRLRIEHLTREAAREAIMKPVERFSAGEVGVEEALVQEVLDQVAVGQVRLKAESGGAGEAAAGLDAAQERIEAPYLQLVMERIWLAERGAPGEEPRSDTLRRSTFVDELGGARSIARAYLEESMSGFTRHQRELAAGAFRFLVTSSAAKIVWSTVDLANVLNTEKEELEPVLRRLADDRILRPVDPPPERPTESRFEIFHDVLATEVLDWRRDWEHQLAERKRRKLVLAVLALALVAAAMALGAVWAFRQKAQAEEAKRQAEAQELAASSIARLDVDPMESIQLALEAVVASADLPDPVPAAENALRQALSASRETGRLLGHEDWVLKAQFSPDGRRAVTSSLDGTARVWDTSTGETVAVLREVEAEIVPASFSPGGDRVVGAASDNTARVWDAESGDALAVLRGHSQTLTYAEFSLDGDRIVTASTDGTARIWRPDTGRQVALLAHGDDSLLTSARFDSEGERVVIASSDGSVRIWDWETDEVLRRLPHLGPAWNPVWAATFSPNGELVATGSEDGVVRIWAAQGESDPRKLRGHSDSADGVEFSPDGELLLSWGEKTARIWNVKQPGGQERVLRHRDFVNAATFSRDGSLVATASSDGAIGVWAVQTGDRILDLRGHGDAAASVDFGPAEELLTASVDGTGRMWDILTGDVLGEHRGWVTSAAFSSNGRRIVTASEDGTSRVWEQRDAGWRSVLTLEGLHAGIVSDAVFSPDGKWIVTTGLEDWQAIVWDASDGLPIGLLGTSWAHEGGVVSVSFDPEGRFIVTTGFSDNTARVWRTPTVSRQSERPVAVLSGHTQAVVAASFSQDGRRIATASLDGTARIWDWETWQTGGTKDPPVTIEAGTLVWGFAFLPSGEQVAIAAGDGTASLWNATTGKREGHEFRGHVGRLASVAFSSDGQRLVTAGSDGTTRVWDVASGHLLSLMSHHADLVNSVVLSPDDSLILSASDDGTARIYPCENCGSLAELVEEAKTRLEAVGIETPKP
jgi:WD40 repeat protein